MCAAIRSTVSRGRSFEQTVLQALTQLRFDLVQVGGKDDRGIDLRGFWRLDDTLAPVVVQCKDFPTRPIQPQSLREFLGAMEREKRINTAGLFFTSGSYSASTLVLHRQTTMPLVLCTMQQDTIVSFVMNRTMHRLFPHLIVSHGPQGKNPPLIFWKDHVVE